GERAAYWPDLIGSDNRFRDIAIFLGGYHTAIDAGPYGIRDCASEVFHALHLVDSGNRRPPLDKDKNVFVCHSLGGIVARYVLTEHHAAFASKRVGLFLIASPSYGSTYASTLHRISELYSHQQGRELAYRSWALDDLDARFRALLDERRIPNLYGMELCEHHFVVRRWWPWLRWLPVRASPLVSRESAGRYFGPVTTIPGSDHSSICKPRDLEDDVHTRLLRFLTDRDLLPSGADTRELAPDMLEDWETTRSINTLIRLAEWLRAGPQPAREATFD